MKKLLFLLLIVPLFSLAQSGENTWDYPVKPGSEEWKELKNNSEKVNICQVPVEILSKATTSELLQICLQYPLLPDIFTFNNIYNGFGKFEDDFNGFRELLSRSDAAIELIKNYKTIAPTAIPPEGTIIEKGNYVLRLSVLELFMSHPLILDKTNLNNKKEILMELLVKKMDKKKRPSWYQTDGLQTNYLTIVHIIQSNSNKYQSKLDTPQITSFIYSGVTTSREVFEQIDMEANQFLKNN